MIRIILLLLIVADLGISFQQYYQQPFDGDVVPIVAPSPNNATVLTSPFGGKAIIDGERYPGSSRYFAHQTMYTYFRTVPLFLQYFFSPVESLYLSAALVKLTTHIFLIIALVTFIVGHRRWWRTEFLALFLLITPFLQTNGAGYYHNIGIIDQTVTYTFFYAFFITILLWIAFPFYRTYVVGRRRGLSVVEKITLPLAMIYLAFSGPLIPPLVILASGWAMIAYLYQQRQRLLARDWRLFKITKRDRWLVGYAAFFVLICTYSHFLAGFNSENQTALSFFAALNLLGAGLLFIATSKLAIPLIVITLAVQFFWLKSYPPTSLFQQRLLKLLPWLTLFLVSYLLLLPLGGVRDYRPNFVRHDTFIPVTLGLIFAVAVGSKLLWDNFERRKRRWLIIGTGLIGLIFTLADGTGTRHECERATLIRIANTPQKRFELPADCTFFSWNTTPAPDLQRLTAKLLVVWGVREEVVELVRE